MWQTLASLSWRIQSSQRIGNSVLNAGLRKFFTLVRRMGFDPTVTATIHGVEMELPLSHNLPYIVAGNPLYDTPLPEVVACMSAIKQSRITMVDVGANIGDTVALVAHTAGPTACKYISIEADTSYGKYFSTNTKGLDVTLIKAIAGGSSGISNLSVCTSLGTGSVSTDGKTSCPTIALRDLDSSDKIDLIKTDTDGYELQVLLGADLLLKKDDSPSLFLEYMPELLKSVGKITAGDLRSFLVSCGYRRCAIWDNTGRFLCETDLTSPLMDDLDMYWRIRPNQPIPYVDMFVSKDDVIMDAVLRKFRRTAA